MVTVFHYILLIQVPYDGRHQGCKRESYAEYARGDPDHNPLSFVQLPVIRRFFMGFFSPFLDMFD